jgi:hypothetical protein
MMCEKLGVSVQVTRDAVYYMFMARAPLREKTRDGRVRRLIRASGAWATRAAPRHLTSPAGAHQQALLCIVMTIADNRSLASDTCEHSWRFMHMHRAHFKGTQ